MRGRGLDFPALFQIQQDALQERPELLLFFRGKHGKQPLFHVRLGEERLAGHLQPLRGQFHKDVPTVLPIRIWTHDFNFTPLSSVILQTDKDGNVYAVDEIVLSSAVAKQAAVEFCERYAGFRGIVYLYGDASGHVGEKHGHASDYVTLEQELRRNGFRVQQKVPRTNPAIKDGQASLNAKICDAMNTRSFFVNKGKCPMLHKGLSTLKLKGGSTFQEEDAEYQHITTAVRYYTAVEFPIKKRDVFFGSSHG